MTKKDYAAKKGWSKAYLSKKDIKDRIAPAMTVDEEGRSRIDSDVADRIFASTADPARSHLRKDAAIAGEEQIKQDVPLSGYQASKADLAAIKAEDARLDLLERKARTLDKQQVVEAVTASGIIIQEQMAAAGRRIAEKAATMTDARAIKSMYDEELRSAFLAAHHDFARRIPLTGGHSPKPN